MSTEVSGARRWAPPRRTRPQPGNHTSALPRLARGSAGVLGFLVIAEIAIRASSVNMEYMPPSSVVLARAAQLLVDGSFLVDAIATVWVWLLGLAIAAGVAIPIGVVLGSVPAIRTATRSLVEFLRPIPSVAMIPLAILLFGAGAQMKIVLIVYASVWPILFNTIYALSDVDPVAKETARAFGFGRLAILRRVSLPSAAPFIATGIRVSMAIALILAISSGLLAGGQAGIGTFIIKASSGGGHTDVVLAAALITGLLGYAANTALERGERELFRWHFVRGEEQG